MTASHVVILILIHFIRSLCKNLEVVVLAKNEKKTCRFVSFFYTSITKCVLIYNIVKLINIWFKDDEIGEDCFSTGCWEIL